MKSLFLGVPFTRPHFDPFVQSLMFAHWPQDMRFKTAAYMPIDSARNALVEVWRQNKTDFLLFVDNDCTFPDEAVLRLMGHDLPIVSGCMYTRTVPPRPTMAKYAGTGDDGKRYYRFAATARSILAYCYKRGVSELKNNAHLFEPSKDDLHEYDAVGMHFTLIRRDVLEKLTQPYFMLLGNTGAGEDFYFCKKAQDAGFSIYADFSVQTGHCVGDELDLGLKDLLKYAEFIPPDDFDAVFSDSFQGRLIVG